MTSPPAPSPFRRGGTKGWFNNEARWVEEACRAFVVLLLLSPTSVDYPCAESLP